MYSTAEKAMLQQLRLQAVFSAVATAGKDPFEVIEGEKGKIAGVTKRTSTPISEKQGEQPQFFPTFEHPDKYESMSADERKKLSADMMRVHKQHSGTKWIKVEEE